MNRRTFLQQLAFVAAGTAFYSPAERLLHLELPGMEPVQVADPEPEQEIESGNWLFWGGEAYPIEGAEVTLVTEDTRIESTDVIVDTRCRAVGVYAQVFLKSGAPELAKRSDVCGIYCEHKMNVTYGAELIFGRPEYLTQDARVVQILFAPSKHPIRHRKYVSAEVARYGLRDTLQEFEAAI